VRSRSGHANRKSNNVAAMQAEYGREARITFLATGLRYKGSVFDCCICRNGKDDRQRHINNKTNAREPQASRHYSSPIIVLSQVHRFTGSNVELPSE
jgi:hypothetical protein